MIYPRIILWFFIGLSVSQNIYTYTKEYIRMGDV